MKLYSVEDKLARVLYVTLLNVLFEVLKLKGNKGISRKIYIVEEQFLILHQLISHLYLRLTNVAHFPPYFIQLVPFVHIQQIVVYLLI